LGFLDDGVDSSLVIQGYGATQAEHRQLADKGMGKRLRLGGEELLELSGVAKWRPSGNVPLASTGGFAPLPVSTTSSVRQRPMAS